MKIKNYLYKKQKDKKIDGDKENVNNNMPQKNHMENTKVEKVTFDVFQEVLAKYLKRRNNQQEEQILYEYLLKQMFEEDGTLKESLKERNRSITVIAGINLMIHGSLL